MKRRLLVIAALLLLALVMAPAQVLAAPTADAVDCDPFNADGTAKRSLDCPCSNNPDDRTYCASATEVLGLGLVERVQIAQIGALKFFASFYWLIARVFLWLTENVLTGNWQTTVREALLDELTTIMGGKNGVLAQIVGGGAGLFAVALMLAGLLMTFPFMQTRMVKVERVLSWAVVLIALFIGSNYGFDLIGGIEALRVRMTLLVAGSAPGQGQAGGLPTDALVNLVALPMMASPTEARTLNNNTLWDLPLKFTMQPYGGESGFFPDFKDTDKKAYRVTGGSLLNDQLELIYRAEMIKPAVLERNQALARMGLVRVIIGYYGALVLFLFGLVFVILTVASLVMIIFFVAALPLGFFEFGGHILENLVKQYMGVVAVSLFAALAVRLLGGMTANLAANMQDFNAILGYIASLTFILFFLLILLKQAWGVTDGAFGVIAQSVEVATSIAGATTSGPITGAVKETGQTLSTAVVAAAVGVATGGLGTAVMAGAGGLVGGSSTGRQVASAANTFIPNSQALQTLSTAAHAGSPLGAATGLVTVARRRQAAGQVQAGQRAQLGSVSQPAIGYDQRPVNRQSGAVSMGNWQTTDLKALNEAEHAYFDTHDRPAAYRSLERAFGSRETAEQALGLYDQGGQAGATQVRRMVQTTQAAADTWTQRGWPLFEPTGELSAPFQAGLGRAYQANGLLDPKSPTYQQDAALAEQIAGAVVRRLSPAWQDPRAAEKIAHDTFDPPLTEIHVGDVAAEYRLRDLAGERGWDVAALKHAFELYPEARSLAQQTGTPVESALFDRLRTDQVFGREDPEALREAARLMTLIGGSAQVQRPTQVTLPAQPVVEAVEAPAQAVPQAAPEVAAAGTAPVAPAQPVQAAPVPVLSQNDAADEDWEVYQRWQRQRTELGEQGFGDLSYGGEEHQARLHDLAVERDQAWAAIRGRTQSEPGPAESEAAPAIEPETTAAPLTQAEADLAVMKTFSEWDNQRHDADMQLAMGEMTAEAHEKLLKELVTGREQIVAAIQAQVHPGVMAAQAESAPAPVAASAGTPATAPQPASVAPPPTAKSPRAPRNKQGKGA